VPGNPASDRLADALQNASFRHRSARIAVAFLELSLISRHSRVGGDLAAFCGMTSAHEQSVKRLQRDLAQALNGRLLSSRRGARA
jgi:hypothetical protein